MLLNIRDVLTLSDPRDPTKPNPWSLDHSFDVRYGLGGMNQITLGRGRSGDDNTTIPTADDPVILILRTVSSGSTGTGPNIDNTGWSPSEKLDARGEEGVNASSDAAISFRHRGFADLAAKLFSSDICRERPSDVPS